MTIYSYHLTPVSANSKVGPLPVSTTSINTCPESCPLMNNGCYAESGPLALHWSKVRAKGKDEKGKDAARGITFPEFLSRIRALPRRALWRHAQAGDTPIDHIIPLARAAKHTRPIWYTHNHTIPGKAREVFHLSRTLRDDYGIALNISASSPREAALIKTLHPRVPVVTVAPSQSPKTWTDQETGTRFVTCPAEAISSPSPITCARCQLCADPARSYVIAFPAHGTSKKKADLIASTN